MKLSVSILNSRDKTKCIELLNNTDISYIHIDTMDGLFVSQKSLPVEEIEKLSKISQKKFDVHLMVKDPYPYLEKLKNISNIEYITIHLEITENIKEILSLIKKYNFKSGISIKPNTPVEEISPYLNNIDLVLLMTVEPGLGGQAFLPQSKERISKLKELVKDKNIKIFVDGGINDRTISEVSEADIAVVGSYITTSDDPLSQIKKLLV